MPRKSLGEPERRAVAARIAERMRDLALSQSELARMIGASQSSLSDWFRTKNPSLPEGRLLVRLPAALRCNGHWLLTGLGEKLPPASDPGISHLQGGVKAAEELVTLAVEQHRRWSAALERAVGQRAGSALEEASRLARSGRGG